MKFKIDECLGPAAKQLIEAAGYDVMTVHEQQLSGSGDDRIYEVCRDEGRVLITLDHDFGHTLCYPPEVTAGIVAVECMGRLTPTMISKRIEEFLALNATRPVDRELWIVEPGRVRIHEKSQEQQIARP
jgi:predicted nuclease of predicted toxin-antitoxin system